MRITPERGDALPVVLGSREVSFSVKIYSMKKKTSASIFNRALFFNPWLFFFIFLISNTVLSFCHLPLKTQLLLVFLGLILPFTAGFKMVLDSPTPEKKGRPEKDLNPPLWLWALFIALVLFTRFYRLTTLPLWLYIDEGYESLLGMSLLNHWDWRLLWSPVPHEPLFVWLLGFYFKLVPPSLFSFRFFSTLISLGTIAGAYWAARAFCSRRVSFLFALILAFSYWSFTLSRLGNAVSLIAFFQCLNFGCLGRWMKASSGHARCWCWAGLAAGNILGFYTWTPWAGLGLSLFFILGVYYWKHPALPRIQLWCFYLISALGVLPLVLARLAPGQMSHIGEIYDFNPLKAFIYNVIGIFWDGSATFNFGSLWGGFLNPILDSLALLGALFFFQKKEPFWRWVLPAAVLISFFPALSAPNDVELYRTLPIIVFLTLSAAAGAAGLLGGGFGKLKLLLTVLILLTSMGMDIYNYTAFFTNNRYIPESLQWRSNAYAQAYQILDQLQRQSGPLYVFSEFTMEYDNRTIDVAVYPFNPLQNPNLAGSRPAWAVVMTNVNYIPFLIKTYPQTRVTLLKKAGDASDSANFIALAEIPMREIPPETLARWKEADGIFRQINLAVLNKNPITPWVDIARSFPPLSKNLKPDPLAAAIYWEKIGLFNFHGKDFKQAAADYESAIHEGYPAAHLYYGLGLSLKMMGEDQKARRAFQKAS
jgi:hypothetical protein